MLCTQVKGSARDVPSPACPQPRTEPRPTQAGWEGTRSSLSTTGAPSTQGWWQGWVWSSIYELFVPGLEQNDLSPGCLSNGVVISFHRTSEIVSVGKKLLWMSETTTELQLLAVINKAVLTLKIKSNQWLMDVWRTLQGGEACIFPANHLLSSRHFSTHRLLETDFCAFSHQECIFLFMNLHSFPVNFYPLSFKITFVAVRMIGCVRSITFNGEESQVSS